MSKNKSIDPSRRPDVSIVYSESATHSCESKNLAFYLAGHLAKAGYSNLFLIGIDAHTGGPAMQLAPAKRVLFSAVGGDASNRKSLVEIPAADLTPAFLDKIQTSNLVVVTVNSNDMTAMKRQLVDMLDSKRQGAPRSTTIFSIQRGVRNAAVIKDAFVGRKDIAVVEGVVGFAVVMHPKTGAYCSTSSTPAIIFERLSKEIEDIADGPLRLMENTDLQSMFDKTLTPYSWGVMVWENLFSLNVIGGGSIRDTLFRDSRAPRTRLLLAAMTRECRLALSSAARGGQWRPQFRLLSSMLNPWLWEMLLSLPWPLSGAGLLTLCCWICGVLPPENIISPGQLDLAEGRCTMTESHLGELLSTGHRYGVEMPVCEAVAARIAKMEAGVREFVPGAGQGSGAALDSLHAELEAKLGGGSASKLAASSTAESKFWVFRFVALLSLIPLLWFLFH